MIGLYIGLPILIIGCLIILTAYICFRRVFYSRPRTPLGEDEYDLPAGEKYVPYHSCFLDWAKAKRALPHRELSVISFDGLTLRGKYYEYKKGAPIELLFHGYRGTAERDLSGAIERCFALGRNAILVDQRAAGSSEGNVISFGINECRDCLRWVDKVIETFGDDTQIVLGGVSMGAATVTMASAEKLPPNVKYTVADCGYTSPRDIIQKVINDMKLPTRILYPFVRLGARLFGHFSLEGNSPIEAVGKSRLPILFFHGDDDDFVPCEMSRMLYGSCTSPKKLTVIHGAAHGLAFPADKVAYIDAIREFERENAVFESKEIRS